jgi:chromosome segregation ATPase
MSKSVSEERDEYKSMYQQINDELMTLRKKKIGALPRDEEESIKDEKLIADLRESEAKMAAEREILKAEVAALQSDIREMVSRQRDGGSIANETITQLESEISNLKQRLEKSLKEKDEAYEELEMFKSQFNNLREENETGSRQIDKTKKTLVQLELENDRLKLLVRDLKSKLANASDECLDFKKQCEKIKAMNEENERVVNEQRQLLQEVDDERDRFQNDLDQKTEKLCDMEGIF